MDFDDDGLDEGPVAPLLPPDDRLWRHPSEVAANPLQAPPARAREPRLLTVVALTSSISVLITLGVVAVVRPVRTQLAVEQVATPADPRKSAIPGMTDVVMIADRLRPAITKVQVDGPEGDRTGSAVLYRSDGHLLTAHHLVAKAKAVTVVFDDGRSAPARVVGGDPDTDIAVLDVEGGDHEVAPLGTASALRAGQPAILIGTPADNQSGPVVSVGVISALGQAVDASGQRLFDMIQTDSAVAPGCAGGALVDAAGVVVGIATMNVARDGGANGYATPIDVARLVAAQLLTHGKVWRGHLGIEGDTLDPKRSPDVGADGGVVVKAVKDGSSAARAGLEPADVIVAIDGEAVPSMVALVIHLRTRRPGDTIGVTVMRGGERRDLRATLSEKP